MAAGATDYFQKTGRSTATTLSSPGYTIGNASINVASTTNWPTDTGVTFAIDEVDSSGARISGTYNVFRGVVSSATQISSLTYVGGDANRDYTAGATTRVYILVSSYRENRLVDGLVVSLGQDGHIATTGVATFTSHIDVNDSSTAIRDSSDNELLKFAKTASAVNELTATNAATGNAPSLSATGGDTNVGLNLVSKGTGEVQINGTAFSGAWTTWTSTLTNITLGNGTITTKYKQIGKTVFGRFELAWGSTTSNGTTPQFTLPVTAASYAAAGKHQIGNIWFEDTGAGNAVGIISLASTTTATILRLDASGTNLQVATVTSTNPGTFGNTDFWAGSFIYEAA